MIITMAPTPRLSNDSILQSAMGIVEARGYDALTVSAVANDLSVAPSALYTYCGNLDGLRNLVAVEATNNLTTQLRNVAIGAAGDKALQSMGAAYRDFALCHASQFAATLRPPAAKNENLAKANASLLEVFTLVYLAMGLDADRSHLSARSTRSALHGFLALEHTTGTSDSHQAEYQHLVDTLQRGLS